MIVVVMGVCGCGKTTVGQSLAEKMNWEFADADDFHSKSNKEKMSKGVPLTDEDRIPWLVAIHMYMQRMQNEGKQVVVTCSALKRFYRHILLTGIAEPVNTKPVQETGSAVKPVKQTSCNQDTERSCDIQTGDSLYDFVLFLHLTGPQSVLQGRLSARQGHFMPASMLTSQLKTLEPPDSSERHINIDISGSTENVVFEAVQAISKLL